MDIKSEYEKLYQQWLKEFKQIELTPLTKEIYVSYKKSLNYVNNFKLDQDDKIKLDLINSYKENFNYIFNDLAKIREIKIINAALALKEIDLNILLEAEKLFYRNLISAIKGFEKVKAMEGNDITDFNILEKNEELKLVENTKLETKESSLQIQGNLSSAITIKPVVEDFKYILVRFLKKTPPLVGIDLLNYGPFERQDIANLPLKNAKILLNEKIAEKIEIA